MTYPDTRLFIAGQWQDAADGKTIAVHNPATGQEIGRVAHAGIADLDRALAAAQKGFEAWRDMPAIERAKTMRRAAALVRERADAIAAIMTQEQGKPRAEARVETLAAADIIEWFADEGMRVYGRIVPSRNLAVRQLVVKDPVGVVAAFTPWNFPINQVVRKLGAALAAGCSMLVKAPEETPASPAELIRAFQDAGIPNGVLGLVYGNPAEISNYLIPHPVVRKVTFTGSTPVGKMLAGLAGQHMKRVTMELGGHAPVIVCEDADIELAVRASGGAKFRNAGQVCIAPTRFLVHEDVRADFVAALTRHAQAPEGGRRPGRGHDHGPAGQPAPRGRHGRLPGRRREAGRYRLHRRRAYRRGGQLLCPHGAGQRAHQRAHLQRGALRPRGLGARLHPAGGRHCRIQPPALWPGRLCLHRLAEERAPAERSGVEVGMLWINQPATPSAELPFGGIKDSGYGSEGGPEALEACLNTRAISITNV